MEVIYWEIKKIINRKLLLIIVSIIIGISIFFKINEYKSFDFIEKKEYQIYKEYIDEYGGIVTNNTINSIKAEETELDNIPQEVLLAKKRLQAEEIDVESYKRIVYINRERQDRRAALNMINGQIEMHTQKRGSDEYLINEYSWIDYFSQTYDYFWLFTLLTFVLIVFANSEAKGKSEMISSTYLGRSRLIFVKYIVSIIITTVIFILFEAINMIIYLKDINFVELNYPIQSISIYEKSSYMFSIKSFIIFSLLLKYIGSLSLVISMSLVFIKIKKEVVAIFIIIITTIMIQLLLDTSPMVAFASFVSLLTPQVLFHAQNGVYNSLLYNPIGIGAIVFFTILFILLVISYAVNLKKIQLKKFNILIVGLLVLCGCNGEEDIATNEIHNFQENRFISTNGEFTTIKRQSDFIFTSDEINYYSIANHLNFEKDGKQITATYLDDKELYYLEVDDNLMGYEIIKVDLDGFHKTLLYKQKIEDSTNFLNFLPDLNIEKTVIASPPLSFAIHNKYLIKTHYSQISIVDLDTNIEQEINDFGGIDEISIFSNKLYYLNFMNEIVQYDLVTQESKKVVMNLVEDFLIDEDNIYYINLENHNYLYIQDTVGQNELIIQQQVERFSLTSKGIYFISKEDQKVYFYDFKSKEINNLTQQTRMEIKGIDNGYYTSRYEDGDMVIEKCESECELIDWSNDE